MSPRKQEPHGREKKRGHFVDGDANREIGRSPDAIDDGESQKYLPGRRARFGLHGSYEHFTIGFSGEKRGLLMGFRR